MFDTPDTEASALRLVILSRLAEFEIGDIEGARHEAAVQSVPQQRSAIWDKVTNDLITGTDMTLLDAFRQAVLGAFFRCHYSTEIETVVQNHRTFMRSNQEPGRPGATVTQHDLALLDICAVTYRPLRTPEVNAALGIQ